MAKFYISNAFALSMLDREKPVPIDPMPCGNPVGELQDAVESGHDIVSIVGHEDTANLFSSILNYPVACNRQSIKLQPFDMMLVGQYIGPRLPAGATELPEGASIEWWLI